MNDRRRVLPHARVGCARGRDRKPGGARPRAADAADRGWTATRAGSCSRVERGRPAALASSSVLVVGAGALGSPVATYLAGAGVGRLRIVDEVTSSSRTSTTSASTSPPTSASRRRAARRPTRVPEPRHRDQALPGRVHARDGGRPGPGGRLHDSFAARSAVNAACCCAGVPLVEAGIVGLTGLVMAIRPGERRATTARTRPSPSTRRYAEAGVLGPAAGVVGRCTRWRRSSCLAGPGPDRRLPATRPRVLDVLRVSVERRPGCPDFGPRRLSMSTTRTRVRARATGGRVSVLGSGRSGASPAAAARRPLRVRARPGRKDVSAGEVLAAWPGVHARCRIERPCARTARACQWRRGCSPTPRAP